MVLRCLARMDPAMSRTIGPGNKRNEILVKKSGTEVPCCPLNSKYLPKNRHRILFSEFGISALAACGPVLMIRHHDARPAAWAVFFGCGDFSTLNLEVRPPLLPFGHGCFFCCRHCYAAPSSLGFGIPRAARYGRSVLFLPSSLS